DRQQPPDRNRRAGSRSLQQQAPPEGSQRQLEDQHGADPQERQDLGPAELVDGRLDVHQPDEEAESNQADQEAGARSEQPSPQRRMPSPIAPQTSTTSRPSSCRPR